MSDSAPRKTPLWAQHEKLGGRLVPFAGYLLPIQYSGIVKEHNAVRTTAGLFDVSHMGQIRASGHGAVDFVDQLVTNDLRAISVSQAMYCCACNEQGGILDDLICYKHADDDVLIVCNASNRAKIWEHINQAAKEFPKVTVEDESEQTALLALQGPRAFEILTRADPSLTELDKELRTFHFWQGNFCEKQATIARTGYTGEDGVEIFCHSEDAEVLWVHLQDAGKTSGLAPAGLGARDTLRLEARLSLYGNELDEETTPLEAGLAWTVKLHKDNFRGQAALARQAEEGIKRRIVGFEMQGRAAARHGYPVVDAQGTALGQVTSGCPSPTLGKPIGLAMVPIEMTEIGTELRIDCRGKPAMATVVKTPFYRRS